MCVADQLLFWSCLLIEKFEYVISMKETFILRLKFKSSFAKIGISIIHLPFKFRLSESQ